MMQNKYIEISTEVIIQFGIDHEVPFIDDFIKVVLLIESLDDGLMHAFVTEIIYGRCLLVNPGCH